MFEIMHVEHEQPFYQLNNLPVYKLRCELFVYNDEDFDVSQEAIQQVEIDGSFRYQLTLNQGKRATATADLA